MKNLNFAAIFITDTHKCCVTIKTDTTNSHWCNVFMNELDNDPLNGWDQNKCHNIENNEALEFIKTNESPFYVVINSVYNAMLQCVKNHVSKEDAFEILKTALKRPKEVKMMTWIRS